MSIQVIGVDPGLVDTGVVSLVFSPKRILLMHEVVDGTDASLVADWVDHRMHKPHVFVEQYRPRQRMDTDVRMVQAEQDLRRALPTATFLPNMGIKRVIPQSLMEVFGCWNWATVTHHQDLRSAARIALLGMVKEPELNSLMADVVRDYLAGQAWDVTHA